MYKMVKFNNSLHMDCVELTTDAKKTTAIIGLQFLNRQPVLIPWQSINELILNNNY